MRGLFAAVFRAETRGKKQRQQIHAFFTHFSRHVFDQNFTRFHNIFTQLFTTLFTTPFLHTITQGFFTHFSLSEYSNARSGLSGTTPDLAHFQQISKRAGKWPKTACFELSFSPKKAHKHDESNGGHESPPGAPPKNRKNGQKTKHIFQKFIQNPLC